MTEQHPENVLASLSDEFDGILGRVHELERQAALNSQSYLDLSRRLDAISPPSLRQQHDHALGLATTDDLWRELTRRIRKRIPDAAVTMTMERNGLLSISTSVSPAVHVSSGFAPALDSAVRDHDDAMGDIFDKLDARAPKLEA